jgi:hypothetical protein
MRLFSEVEPLEPMLAHFGGRRLTPYYIVPFTRGRAKTRAAMILNAFTGEYEESIVLPRRCFFLYQTQKQALELAVKKLKVPRELLSTPRLIFKPSIETPYRFFPVWQVRIRRDVYVTPYGEAVHRLATTEHELWRRFRR